MSRNVFLDEGTSRDIDEAVSRVLHQLEPLEPPLYLEEVRDALRLDRDYYSSRDGGVLQETIHRLKVAGKQIVARPALLLDVVRKFSLRALWLPDRKRILIDSDLPMLKQRWGEAHEIGHSLIPWHEPLMHGDHRRTLSPDCHEQIEAEANYAAGRLVFLQDRFTEEVRSSEANLNTVMSLSRTFGNTITSTLWRTVESLEAPAVGLVSIHPQREPEEGAQAIRYFLRSRAFEKQFHNVTGLQLFRVLREFCFGTRGLIGRDEVIFEDDAGADHTFFVEAFDNSYEVLTLGVHKGLRAPSVPTA